MALYKEMTNSKGVVTRYFRISNITFIIDRGSLDITVTEYADESYREIEKNIKELKHQISTLQTDINILNENYKDNEATIVEKNKELYDLVDKLNNLNTSSYHVDEKVYSFNFEDQSYSITDCYNLLKTLDVFVDSTNV